MQVSEGFGPLLRATVVRADRISIGEKQMCHAQTISNPGYTSSISKKRDGRAGALPSLSKTAVFLGLYDGTDLRNSKRRRSDLETDE